MIDKITWLGHSSIKFSDSVNIYVDPYKLTGNYNDADIIFITHNHYDHFSPLDIKKCVKSDSYLVITSDLYNEALELDIDKEKIIVVTPNNEYNVKGINFKTVPSYNTNKKYHPKENNWVGYVINFNGYIYYIAGDTDITEEAKNIKCDVAFLPIGGTFTMDYREAALLANTIKPSYVIPIHYGTIVGTYDDAVKFKENVSSEIVVSFLNNR